VLGRAEVGLHENFFELGGHSLQAVQLAASITAAMERHVPVKLIYLHPTVAELAAALVDQPAHGSTATAADSADTFSATPQDEQQTGAPAMIRFERRPLLSLIAAGKMPPVDTAAFSYLPGSLLREAALERDEIIQGWCDNLPVVSGMMQTAMGRIAHILLPRFDNELFRDQQDLVAVILDALEISGHIGARTVALTGLLPSVTDQGRVIAGAIGDRHDLPLPTTGHATTAAAVVLAIEKILAESGRDLAQERVGFLGMGSIGTAVLGLMARVLPHPADIALCDVPGRRAHMEQVAQELVADCAYRGGLRVIESGAVVPAAFYNATLIVGAANVPDILDINHVQPGTLLVDDSAPHCFEPAQAIQRFEEQHDLLFTEGGVLHTPYPIDEVRFLPRAVERSMTTAQLAAVSYHNPFMITGCVLSSLLVACFPEVKPSIGYVDRDTCLQHRQLLARLQFSSPPLHCGNYTLGTARIRLFRRRFGQKE
jgi:predicted amino acid dehydrogenase